MSHTDLNSTAVSVLINTKNRSQLISRAVDSVLKQDFTDFELLIMDASTDENTAAVMERYDDPRIIYERIRNEKHFTETNRYAISKCRGIYIALIDDDDEWISSEKLSKQVSLIESLPDDYGVVYCWYEMWHDDINQAVTIPLKANRGDLFEMMLYDNAIMGAPTLLIKKKLYTELWANGGDPSVLPSDHYLMTVFSQTYKFDLVPEVLVRCHERHQYGSMGRTPSPRFTLTHRLNLSLKFYQTFPEGYRKYPKARKRLLERIISGAAKAGSHGCFLKYFWIYMVSFLDLKFMARALYRYIYYIFKPSEQV